MGEVNLKDRLVDRNNPARIWAGQAKFRASQTLANTTVSLYRRIRGIDDPITERFVFVLAHPRSGSTVLTHVLHGHGDIAGFGEHHVGYESTDDLDQLASRTAYFAREPRLSTRYVLDKIVWNQHTLAPEILAAHDVRFIFLVREPAATFESYRRMFPDLPTDADRLRSYRRRLVGMVEQAETIADPSRAYTLTYEQLTQDTPAVLADLTEWLELDTPLASDYALTSKTGSQSWGDPSSNIKAGTVLKLDRETAAIDPEVSDAAERVYASTVRTLATLTTTPPAREPGPAPRAAERQERQPVD